MPISRYKLDDISHFLNALAHFPYINGVTSLLSALYDLFDIFIHSLKSNVVLRNVILKSALSRFIGNTLIGLAKLTPLLTVASILVASPWIIPILTLIPVSANFVKYTKLSREWKKIVHEKTLLFNHEPTTETLHFLKEARDALYHSTQEQFISFGLVLGASLSLVGILFPPLLIPGIVLSITCALTGFLDKRYQYSKKISQYIFGDFETAEENLVKKNELLKALTVTKQPAPIKTNPTTSMTLRKANLQGLALNQSAFFSSKQAPDTQKYSTEKRGKALPQPPQCLGR